MALIEGSRCVAVLEHDAPHSHAEHLLPLVERALTTAAWDRTDIERIAVGVGPGSFTGLRVGIALAQGMALGLGAPLIGVGSLQAMAAGVPGTDPRCRCALLDARREEIFLAAYTAYGVERLAPSAVPRSQVEETIRSRLGPETLVVGLVAAEVAPTFPHYRSAITDLPHAAAFAAPALDIRWEPNLEVTPIYVREADAVLPRLPPSPLGE